MTAIITAIATGAAEALGDTAKQVIQDLYAGIKKLIQDKYQKASSSLEALENNPKSNSKRESLKEDLQSLGAEKDNELLKKAQALLVAIEEHAPHIPQTIGIKLEDITAANIRLKDIIVSGDQSIGVDMKKVKAKGDIEISNVKVGENSPKTKGKGSSRKK